MNKKFISWRRVSTFRQSKSGLGLAAQKEIIRYFIEREGGEWVADYEECYTGKDLNGCVELQKAIEHCKRENAILIIAKSDRFRNTAEALQIYEKMGDGNIMFCDLPHTDKFTLTLFFALAEREALIVSIRTKQALAAKKAKGEKIGAASDNYHITKEKKAESASKAGATRTRRVLEKRDTQVLIQIMKKVFPKCRTTEESKWCSTFVSVNLKSRKQFFDAMVEYQSIDNDLFRTWDLSDFDNPKLVAKLTSKLQSIVKMLTR